MSDLKITLNGKPIGEAMNERIEKKFYQQIFTVTENITESTDDFILTTIAGSEINERRLPKERVRRAFDLLFAEDEGRITERKKGKWVLTHPLQDDDAGAYVCSCCKSGSWEVIPKTWKACPWCEAKMEEGD